MIEHLENPSKLFRDLHAILAPASFRLLETRPGGTLPLVDFASLNPRRVLAGLVRALTYPLMKGHKRGWCLLFVFQKVDAYEARSSGVP